MAYISRLALGASSEIRELRDSLAAVPKDSFIATSDVVTFLDTLQAPRGVPLHHPRLFIPPPDTHFESKIWYQGAYRTVA